MGYTTTAFDVSRTAVTAARRRFPHSAVRYKTADLLSPPPSWAGAFDLVVEVFTVQVLTGAARRTAIARTAQLVAPGGRLLVIAGAHGEHDDPGQMPWPLTRAEIESFGGDGLTAESIVDFFDYESRGRYAAGGPGSPPLSPSAAENLARPGLNHPPFPVRCQPAEGG